MKAFQEFDSAWMPLSTVAREFHKTPQTLRNWCHSGFMLQLGYRVYRGHKGHWFVAKMQNSQNMQNSILQ